ncbi:MAG: response regulator [Bacteroidetes bacterium]|nr:response regulator [Bacteroidota bacterium]
MKNSELPFSGKRVLVVDDSPLNIQLISHILKSFHLTISTGSNGLEALDHLAEFECDLIFMDIHMPGMDGIEATRQIRMQEIPIPIIALTADSSLETQVLILDAGFDALLIKPFNKEKMIKLMKQFLV